MKIVLTFLVRLLIKMKPEKNKRLILLSALIGKMTDSIDDKSLDLVNRSLAIAENTNAIKFPMSISDEILGSHFKKQLELELRDNGMTGAADLIYNTIPDWLRYSHTGIKKDLETLHTVLNLSKINAIKS